MSRLQQTAHADRRTVRSWRATCHRPKPYLLVHRHRSFAQIAMRIFDGAHAAIADVLDERRLVEQLAPGTARRRTRRRRSVSRAVSSSGRIAKARPLEGGQTVAELHPADVVAEPGMMRGRKRPRRIQAAGGDVDEIRCIEMFVGERRTAGAAEVPLHLRATTRIRRGVPRVKRNSALANVTHATTGDAADTPARLAVADHAVRRIRGRGITHGAAHAAALNVLIQVPLPLRERAAYRDVRRLQKKSPA